MSLGLFFFLSILGQSRAAVTAIGLLFFMSLPRRIILALTISGISLISLLYFKIINLDFLPYDLERSILSRFFPLSRLFYELSNRGYNRFIDNIDYIWWGAGEGLFERFSPIFEMHFGKPVPAYIELHSALGTVLFSYGPLGFILFFLFLFKVFKKPNRNIWCGLGAIFFLSLLHNTLRNPYLWIYFSLAYSMARSREVITKQ